MAGGARRGVARLGMAGHGEAWHGKAGMAWRGLAGLGGARRGQARQGRQGVARRGEAWQGGARLGKAGHVQPEGREAVKRKSRPVPLFDPRRSVKPAQPVEEPSSLWLPETQPKHVFGPMPGKREPEADGTVKLWFEH